MSEKWGVAGLGVTENGAILIFPENSENIGKKEKVVGVGHEMEDIGNRLEAFGGAVEEGDWVGLERVLPYALMREVREERGLDLSYDQIQLMPEGIEVLQLRDSREVNFLVACFVVNLNSEQEECLRKKGAVDCERSENVLRPRDREMVNIYRSSIGIPVELPIKECV